MVGIVLVSHSRELSEAVKALADQQIHGRAVIVAVGGSDNPFQPFGTDPVAIADAIREVDNEDGVLVLMDLGSAVISGRVALDLLEPERLPRVHLSVGPFIEGAMAAAVQASIGMGLSAVAREAEEAMHAKRAVLLQEESQLHVPEESEPEAGYASAEVTVLDPAGLHFGPAARFVQSVAQFKTPVHVSNLTTGAGPANATSFNQLLSLGVQHGHRIQIVASGPHAESIVNTLTELVARHDDILAQEASGLIESAYAPVLGSGAEVLIGLPASPGLALGIGCLLAEPRDLLRSPFPDPEEFLDFNSEWRRLEQGIAAALLELDDLAEQVHSAFGPQQADIFRAHGLLLQDADITQELRRFLEINRLPLEAAIQQTFLAVAQRYRERAGDIFQQRAADVEDVGRRLLRIVSGAGEDSIDLPAGAIVVAHDLSPSQTAGLDRSRLAGLCIASGGPQSHTAILARSMGIPAIVGLGRDLLNIVTDGVPLAIDGAHGQVIVAPDPDTVAAYRRAQATLNEERTAAWRAAQRPSCTRDGLRVEVVANLSYAADAELALAAGAEGVGLLRTEFLFQDRSTPPSEEEQYELYRLVAERMQGRPLVIRTLDIGGDKPAPYLSLPHENNPFLGWRAIRISLALSEFFKTQLRALLRAAVHGNVHVLLPMVSNVSEVQHAQTLLGVAMDELASEDLPHSSSVPLGIMVEVPSAVQLVDQLAPLVDFFSIGTNDLTQYTFAADRTNERVAALADPLHPAILRQIDSVIRVAHEHGKWCGLCGELAGQSDAIPVLLGLGLDEFSMAPASIPAAKQLISHLAMPVVRRLAQRALNAASGDAVRALVREVVR
ncbi:MAG: phosphoenolpyruvate--protein phosphotransferase [Caldilineaceae bacterium]